MNTIKLIATFVILTWAGATFSHENHASAKTAVAREQKEWGIAGDAGRVSRTITVTMSDNMRFTPDSIEVKQGETIRLVINNTGHVLHELVIGTKKELEAHAALMLKFPDMQHDEPYMAHVAPGTSGQLVWAFNRAGSFDFACLIPGHYQAGMVGKIHVAAAQ